SIRVDISRLFRLAAQPRSAEQLQKAQLQLLRLQGKHIVKGFFEGIVILLRQSGDQVQMLDDLSPLPDAAHGAGQLLKVLPPLDQLVGEGIGRLHPDFEAEDARGRVFVQEPYDLRPKNVGGDLKLEDAPAVVVDQKAEQFHGVGAMNVEGAVNELNGFRSVPDQVENILFDPVKIKIANSAFDGRQAELAAERTAAAGLHVHDALGEVRPIFGKPVRRGDPVQIQLGTRRIDDGISFFTATGEARDVSEVARSRQFLKQLFKGFLSLP